MMRGRLRLTQSVRSGLLSSTAGSTGGDGDAAATAALGAALAEERGDTQMDSPAAIVAAAARRAADMPAAALEALRVWVHGVAQVPESAEPHVCQDGLAAVARAAAQQLKEDAHSVDAMTVSEATQLAMTIHTLLARIRSSAVSPSWRGADMEGAILQQFLQEASCRGWALAGDTVVTTDGPVAIRHTGLKDAILAVSAELSTAAVPFLRAHDGVLDRLKAALREGVFIQLPLCRVDAAAVVFEDGTVVIGPGGCLEPRPSVPVFSTRDAEASRGCVLSPRACCTLPLPVPHAPGSASTDPHFLKALQVLVPNLPASATLRVLATLLLPPAARRGRDQWTSLVLAAGHCLGDRHPVCTLVSAWVGVAATSKNASAREGPYLLHLDCDGTGGGERTLDVSGYTRLTVTDAAVIAALEGLDSQCPVLLRVRCPEVLTNPLIGLVGMVLSPPVAGAAEVEAAMAVVGPQLLHAVADAYATADPAVLHHWSPLKHDEITAARLPLRTSLQPKILFMEMVHGGLVEEYQGAFTRFDALHAAYGAYVSGRCGGVPPSPALATLTSADVLAALAFQPKGLCRWPRNIGWNGTTRVFTNMVVHDAGGSGGAGGVAGLAKTSSSSRRSGL